MRGRLYLDQHEASMRRQPFKKSPTAIASFLPHSAMTEKALEYPPAGDSLSVSMLATSCEAPILAIKRPRSTDSDEGRRQRPRHESQMINNLGISGNARVVNVGGDQTTNNYYGLGAETQAVLESIEQRLKVVDDKELGKEVDGWLSAPDVSQNLNAALRRRQAGTGCWFLDGTQFQEWKETPNMVLCIYGAPGCGKTVLCASIIKAVKDSCKTRLSGWAYFFFDSRNANKGLQLYENFLRSVLSQLCSRCGGIPEAIKAMYQAHGNGNEQPSVEELEEALREVIEAFDDVYIIVDSLDECGDRSELLKWIETVAKWSSARWHLLTASRSEPDVTSHLERIPNLRIVHLQGTALDKDIIISLDQRLSLINRWSEPVRALIKTTLIEGAGGMFRWVAMQMDSLENCLNVRAVMEKLNTLPKDLEETYEQILAGSPHRHDLLYMLHWLAFSTRALRLEEIAEVPSVDFDAADGPCYDSDLKYANCQTALTVCSGLITETDGIVKLAHFSVKEYLISDHIKTGTAAHFAINLRLSHSVIAQTCVAYLLIFNQSDSIERPGGTAVPFPLQSYAAQQLPEHLRLMENSDCPALQELLHKLFIPTPRYESALVNWVRVHTLDPFPSDGVAAPLYYASFLGLRDVVESLLENGADVELRGGWYNTALQAAVVNAHTETAELLVERGASINRRDGYFGSALLLAAQMGHTDIAKSLLEHGGDPNIQGGEHGNALKAAASRGYTEIVQLLLKHDADPNIQGEANRSALLLAAEKGHTNVAKILLEHNADPDNQGGANWTALQAAAVGGHTEIAQLLLQLGVDPNIEGGKHRNAIWEAAARGYAEIVQLLLQHGTDPNIEGRKHGSAIREAAAIGYTEIVQLLLQHGADPNIHDGGADGNALLLAAGRGHTNISKILLEHGADPNNQGGADWTALQAAVAGGHTEVAQLLLQHGVDPNIEGGRYGNAMQAAADGNQTTIIKILLEYGAKVSLLPMGGRHTAVLEAPVSEGATDVVKMLPECGADVNFLSRDHLTSLREAAFAGHTEIVKTLLQSSTQIDLQGGVDGTPLQAAVSQGHTDIVKMLLECGTDVNFVGGPYDTALQAAAASAHTEIVKLLLEYGADANIQGGQYGTALRAAAANGHTETAKLLLEGGADPNIERGFDGTALYATANWGHTETAKLLLEAGANVNFQSGLPAMTALQVAAACGHTETQQLLLHWSEIDFEHQLHVFGGHGEW